MSVAMVEPGTALEQVRTGSVMQFAMTPAEAKGWSEQVREMKVAVLRDGSDYMVIPGTPKPTLLKPGAEMLLLAAGLGFSLTKIIDPSDVDRGGVTYRATIHRGTKDNVVSECDGYAGYDEANFFTSAEENEAKERVNAERYERPVRRDKFVEFKAPWNSVVKMAIKRALVGATLNACAASGLFTQDLEDERKPAVIAWDPTVAVKPYIDGLSADQATELKKWWKKADNGKALPSLAHLSPEQGARVLFQVGVLSVAKAPEAEMADEKATVTEESPPPTSAPVAETLALDNDPDARPFTED